MKHDYTDLDAAIVAKIKAGAGDFDSICRALSKAAEPFVLNPRNPSASPAETWRVIDRRLQALRKRGRITYRWAERRWYAE